MGSVTLWVGRVRQEGCEGEGSGSGGWTGDKMGRFFLCLWKRKAKATRGVGGWGAWWSQETKSKSFLGVCHPPHLCIYSTQIPCITPQTSPPLTALFRLVDFELLGSTFLQIADEGEVTSVSIHCITRYKVTILRKKKCLLSSFLVLLLDLFKSVKTE